MASVRKSLAISSIEKNIYTILNLVMMVAVSRLLSPDEIGIHVIGASIAMLASELKAFGMGGYLIREKKITLMKVRSTFTVSMIFAFSLGLLLIATSPIVADFYNDQRLVPVLLLFSIGFFVSPFSIVTAAVLTREFEFGKLSVARLSEVTISAAVTLVLIYFEFGYLSLAIGTAIGNITSAVIFIILKPKIVNYWPHFKSLNDVMESGFFTSVSALIRRAATVSPELIIGKMAGINDAALFSRGAGFIKFSSSLIFSMVSPVVAPFLSKSNREGALLSESYIRVNILVGGICWPILAVAGLFAEQAITVMFGDQWTSSASIASILAIWALLGMLFVNFEQLLLTISQEKISFYYQMTLTVSTIFLCVLAALTNSSYVPAALVLSGLLRVLVQAILFEKFFSVNFISYLWKLRSSIAVTATCFVLALGIKYFVTDAGLSALYSILILALAMPLCWLLIIAAFQHPIYSEVKIILFTVKKYVF